MNDLEALIIWAHSFLALGPKMELLGHSFLFHALTVQDSYARSIPAIRGKDGRYRPKRRILDILSLGAVGWDSLCVALVVPASDQEKEVKAPHDWYRNTGPLFSIVIIMAP